jgi:hypothetical protein
MTRKDRHNQHPPIIIKNEERRAIPWQIDGKANNS